MRSGRAARMLDWLRAPHVARVAGTSEVVLRTIAWHSRVRRSLERSRVLALMRLGSAARIAYYVLPLDPIGFLTGRLAEREPVAPPQPAKPTIRIIANPAAGTLRNPQALRDLYDAANMLTAAGAPAEVCLTERAGHAVDLARDAAKAGMDMVVAAGGDGTVNDVIQGLAGYATALGVLPLGTVNVWAREVGIPLSTPEAAHVLLHGARRRVDLGRAGARYFLMMAGIGFDAEVARRVERGRLRKIGLKMVEYLATAGFLSLTQKPVRVYLRIQGKRRGTSALMVLIGNTRLYGGALTFTRHAVADDGVLDVVIIGGGGLIYRATVLRNALLRRTPSRQRVRYERARSVRIDAETPLPVQVDGEVVGRLPMTFSVAPLALTVIVPADAPDALFSRPPLAPR